MGMTYFNKIFFSLETKVKGVREGFPSKKNKNHFFILYLILRQLMVSRRHKVQYDYESFVE